MKNTKKTFSGKRSLAIKKKVLVVIAFFLFLELNVNAQNQISAGVNAGVSTSGYRSILAPELRYQINGWKHFAVPLTIGYIRFKPAFIEQERGAATYEYITVKGGLKYYFNSNNSGAYALAEAGAAFGTKANGVMISGAKSDSGTALVFSPAVGYAWRNGLDAAVKYEGYSAKRTIGYIGIRFAYGFKL